MKSRFASKSEHGSVRARLRMGVCSPGDLRPQGGRAASGSVLPIVAFSLLVTFAFLAVVVDVMRQFWCIEKLQHAAQAAALDLLPFACQDAAGLTNNAALCTADGAMLPQVQYRLQQALSRSLGANAAQWNIAAAGETTDDSRPPEKAVFIEAADVVSAGSEDTRSEIADRSELVLRVRARRQGSDALNMIFAPVAYAAGALVGADAIPEAVYRSEHVAMAEVIGQPAARIGPGAPQTTGDSKAAEIWRGRLACFPLAIDYRDFNQPTLQPGSANQTLTVRVTNPGAAAPASTIRGYFVNLLAGGTVGGYYRDAGTPARFDELVGLLRYFSRSQSLVIPQPLQIPQAVERGVTLDRFDSRQTTFDNADLRSILQDLAANSANRCYIIPVVAPGGSSQSSPLGFAWLKLLSITEPAAGIWEFNFQAADSLCVLNASAGAGLKSIPAVTGQRLPPAPLNGPFAGRRPATGSNSIPPRWHGVVLAPALSPRGILAQDV